MGIISQSRVDRLLRKAKEKQLREDPSLIQTNQLPDDFAEACALFKVRSAASFVPFKLYPYQQIVNGLIDKYPVSYFLKSRQTGMSSTITMKFLVESIRQEALNSMAFMLDQNTVTQLSDKLRYAIESAPNYAKTINNNVGRIVLNNKSQIIFKGGYSVNSSRGIDSVKYVLIDEFLHQTYLRELIATVSPTQNMLGKDARTIFCGTPETRTGYGYELMRNIAGENLEEIANDVAEGKLYKDNIEGLYYIEKGNSVLIFTHFMAVPTYREWGRREYLEFRKEKDQTSWENILKEYHLQFATEEATAVFDRQLINSAIAECEEDEPDDGALYYGGYDSAGVGVKNPEKSDFASFTLLKYKKGVFSVVKWYRKRNTTAASRCGEVAETLIKFRCRKCVIESNNMGSTYYSQLQSIFLEKGYHCDLELFHTSQANKPQLVGNISLKLEQGRLKFSASNPLVEELIHLVRTSKGKLEAAPKFKDDTVVSLGLALYKALSQEELLQQQKQEERQRPTAGKKIKF